MPFAKGRAGEGTFSQRVPSPTGNKGDVLHESGKAREAAGKGGPEFLRFQGPAAASRKLKPALLSSAALPRAQGGSEGRARES